MSCNLLTIVGFAFSCGSPSGPVRPALCGPCLLQQSSQKSMSQYEQSHTGDFSNSQLSHSLSCVSLTFASFRSPKGACDDSDGIFGISRETAMGKDSRARPEVLVDSDLESLNTGISGVQEGGRMKESTPLLYGLDIFSVKTWKRQCPMERRKGCGKMLSKNRRRGAWSDSLSVLRPRLRFQPCRHTAWTCI